MKNLYKILTSIIYLGYSWFVIHIILMVLCKQKLVRGHFSGHIAHPSLKVWRKWLLLRRNREVLWACSLLSRYKRLALGWWWMSTKKGYPSCMWDSTRWSDITTTIRNGDAGSHGVCQASIQVRTVIPKWQVLRWWCCFVCQAHRTRPGDHMISVAHIRRGFGLWGSVNYHKLTATLIRGEPSHEAMIQ
jgi:hypothetical protein